MVTFVGTQSDFGKAVQELVELEYDVIEAYDAAINRVENSQYKSQLEKFRNDLRRHIDDFSKLLTKYKMDVPAIKEAVKTLIKH
jgi:rubrerythrin